MIEMAKIIILAGLIAFCLWTVEYTGPITPQNPNFIISAFLWLMVVTSSLSIVVKVLKLPFRRKR